MINTYVISECTPLLIISQHHEDLEAAASRGRRFDQFRDVQAATTNHRLHVRDPM